MFLIVVGDRFKDILFSSRILGLVNRVWLIVVDWCCLLDSLLVVLFIKGFNWGNVLRMVLIVYVLG